MNILVLESKNLDSHIGRRMQIFTRLSNNNRLIVFGRSESFILKLIKLKSFSFRFKYVIINDNMVHITTPDIFFPFYNSFRILNRINGFILRGCIKYINNKFNFCPDLYWVAYPYAVDSLSIDKKIVYDCFDNHSGFKGLYSKSVVDKIELDLLKISNHSFFSSEYLFEKLYHFAGGSTSIVRNGADYDHFYIDPINSLISGNIILYVGVISDWCDIQLIEDLCENADLEFWFVGPVRNNLLHRVQSYSNVKIFGQIEYKDLMFYIKSSTVCIIPFKSDIELIKSTNPIKLYEYLAAGKPVVSTFMPEVSVYKEFVSISENNAVSFYNSIIYEIENNSIERVIERQNLALANSWSSRVRLIEEIIND